MDRERVIGHLGILRTWCAVNPAYGRGLDVEECGRAVGWLDDAIGMLKAEGERETTSSVSAGGAATFPKGEGKGEAQGAVVRCRECRHCRLLNDGVSFECKELEMDFYAPQYDAATYYCADGERRDGA